MRWYWHIEQNGWQFFNDPDHPELVAHAPDDWWNANTDPSLVFYEPDIFHSYSGRARFPDPVDGSKWDAFGFWQANTHRLVGWHVKDGTRLASSPHRPANPFTQTVVRPPTFAPAGLATNDALYTGEGSIAKGYPFDPDPAVVGFKKIFDDVGNKGAKFFDPRDGQRDRPAHRPGPLAPARQARDRVPARAPGRAEHTRLPRSRG